MALNEDKVENVIKTLLERSRKQNNEYILFGNLYVYVRDSLPEGFDLEGVFEYIYSKMPQHLFSEVDAVYIGNFEELQDRQVQSIYKDGAIYVTNSQSNSMDMIEDIIHELSHSIEEPYGMLIYGDNQINSEFIGKRIRLRDLLAGNGFQIEGINFEESEFDKDFDLYLYETIGYPILINLTAGLFNNPYAATSLREYFASGFEEYILGDKNLLKSVSPALFNKIQEIILNG
jgi:hypothetical protein